jgi:hypothetical protein
MVRERRFFLLSYQPMVMIQILFKRQTTDKHIYLYSNNNNNNREETKKSSLPCPQQAQIDGSIM